MLREQQILVFFFGKVARDFFPVEFKLFLSIAHRKSLTDIM
jgi:hypothetical protein